MLRMGLAGNDSFGLTGARGPGWQSVWAANDSAIKGGGLEQMTVKLSWTDRFLFSAFFRRLVFAIAVSLVMLILVIYFVG